MSSQTTTTAAAPAAVASTARLALLLALLGLPGCTIAWDLPAGGYWIGMPLAVAAIALGVRALGEAGSAGRRLATAAIVLAAIEILFTATWTVA